MDELQEPDENTGSETIPLRTLQRQDGDQDRSLELAGSDFLLGC
jgi:hypothetical protein